MEAVSPPFSHCDVSVFPDDTRWYSLFEKYVADHSTHSKVFQATDMDRNSTAVLPLVQSRNRLGRVTLASMENYYSVDFRPLCSTLGARSLIEPLLGQITGAGAPDILRLQPLDNDAPETLIIEQALHKVGWRVCRTFSHTNWVHDFAGSFEDYIRERPGRLRSTLRRKSAKLMALEGIRLSIHDGQIGLDNLLRDYQIIYARSWKVPEPDDQFVPELISEMARRGQLRLGFLKIGDRPVAVHFWIVKHGHAYIYKLAHDSDFDQYSPGTVLMARMVQNSMEKDGITRLDFLTGDDNYKQDWMTERRRKLSITAYNPKSLHGIASHLLDKKGRPFVKHLTKRFKIHGLFVAIADKIFLNKCVSFVSPVRTSAVSKPRP